MSASAPVKSLLKPILAAPAKPSLTPVRAAVLQRACQCGGGASPTGECQECKKKQAGETTPLQRSAQGPAATAGVPSLVNQVLSSPGRPLDSGTRGFMESRFGHDFSRVRIHDDSRAAESAHAVNARAYTVGQNIAFAAGQYRPHTREGTGLLAHELAHTVQQAGLQRAPANSNLDISPEDGMAEREATAAAAAVLAGQEPVGVSQRPGLALQRAPWGECPVGAKRTLNAEFGETLKRRAVAAGAKAAAAKATATGVPAEKPLAESLQPRFFTTQVAEAAEDHIAEFFGSDRGRYAHTNKRPLSPEEVDPESNPVQYMINEAWDHFRSGGSTKPKKKSAQPKDRISTTTTTSPQPRTTVTPVDPVAIDERRAAEALAPSRQGAQLKPDFVDFERAEVYDATTIDNAGDKVQKIKGYRDLYEAIRVNAEFGPIGIPAWTVGTTLGVPNKITFGVQNDADPIKICFGVTDFARYPGVLAYQVVDTSNTTAVDPAASNAVGEPYEIATKAGATATLDAGPPSSSTDLLNSGPENLAATRVVRGLVLKTLKRGKTTKQDRIIAGVISEGCAEKGEKPAIPIVITSGKGEIELQVDPKTRIISLAKSYAGYKFKSKHLSEGTLTKFDIDSEEGALGVGKLTPSLSIFKGLEFGIEFSESRYEITAGLKEEQLKKVLRPFPGARLTKAQLTVLLYPAFLPKGELAMELKAGERKVLDASVEVQPGAAGGLYAEGTLNAYIPGVDKAEGKVIYDKGKWSAFAEATSAQMRSPFTGGQVKAGFNDQGVYGEGTVDLEIPGGPKAQVGLHYRKGNWFFSGRGEYYIKRLGTTVGLRIDYFDGEKLVGEGAVKGFKFKEHVSGDITVHYAGRLGSTPRVWGEGAFHIKKGKVNGHLALRLLETGKFTGEGGISYEIRPGLVASAGISLDKDEKVKLTGSLTFPPYLLFDKFPKPPKDRIDLFQLKPKRIGVPYLSFGPAGLQAQIRAGIFANYSIGPAVIIGGFIKTVIDNPLDDNPDIDLELGGKLTLPASFSVTGYIAGGLVLDVLIAEAGGEISVSASAILAGEAASNFSAHYGKGVFEASADFSVLLKLVLTLCFDAYAWAEAGFWRFKASTGKSWHLGHFSYDPGLQLGMKMNKPLKYSSETGFDAGGVLDGIEWIKPKFDPSNALESSFGEAGGSESESKPKPNPCPRMYAED